METRTKVDCDLRPFITMGTDKHTILTFSMHVDAQSSKHISIETQMFCQFHVQRLQHTNILGTGFHFAIHVDVQMNTYKHTTVRKKESFAIHVKGQTSKYTYI